MTENNIDDLRKARYMSLSCPPALPEAKGLVEDIIDIITKSEKRQRPRKADEVPVFESAVGLIKIKWSTLWKMFQLPGASYFSLSMVQEPTLWTVVKKPTSVDWWAAFTFVGLANLNCNVDT